MTSLLMLLAFGIGAVAGLRATMAPAIVAWAVRLQVIGLGASSWSFIGSNAAVATLTVLALLELVNDKLPRTKSRTLPGPLIARLVTGGISGALLGIAAGAAPWGGAFAGVAGALFGTFGGHRARVGSVRRWRVPDFAVALAEDVLAVAMACVIVSSV